jgi:hypothetical protein
MYQNRTAKLTLPEAKEVVTKVLTDAKETFGISIEITEPIRQDLSDDYWCLNIQTEPCLHANELEVKLDTLFNEEDNISFQLSGGTTEEGIPLGNHFVLIFDEV